MDASAPAAPAAPAAAAGRCPSPAIAGHSLLAAMPPPRLVVEYAKSSRASCKACGQSMPKGSLRLGSVTKAEAGFDITRWHHPSCFIKASSNEKIMFDEIDGVKSLKAGDQENLKSMIAEDPVVLSEAASKKLKIEDTAGDLEEILKVLKDFSHLHLMQKYKEVGLPNRWKSFSTVITYEPDDMHGREKIASFDFDGCLVKTSVQRHGADAWSLLYPSIPKIMQGYYNDGYKLVVFTNESNIDRWKNSRQKAIDSKIGRLEGFMNVVNVPIQVFIACAQSGTGDLFRKPKHGMWVLMEQHFNKAVSIDKESSFYVGDAAGRPNDHSDADIGFAKGAGVKFLLPEDVFL